MPLNAARQVDLKLETPWRDGPTHLAMSPLEFMQRLAALVRRPRLHLIRFHAVLAPNAKLRALVVPQGPEAEEQVTEKPRPPAIARLRPSRADRMREVSDPRCANHGVLAPTAKLRALVVPLAPAQP